MEKTLTAAQNTKPFTAKDLTKNDHALIGPNGIKVFTDHGDFILVWTPRAGRIAEPQRMSREDARREWDDLRASGLRRFR